MSRVWGADEAGRGPILGPMAIAVVGVDRTATRALRKLGVADSKSFGSGEEAIAKRRELAIRIREIVPAHRVQLVDAGEIDRYTFQGQLNALERRVVAGLLELLEAAREATVICDGHRLFAPLRARFPRLRAVDDGESAHPSVAAASILAKDARDAAFARIAARDPRRRILQCRDAPLSRRVSGALRRPAARSAQELGRREAGQPATLRLRVTAPRTGRPWTRPPWTWASSWRRAWPRACSSDTAWRSRGR
jgi:ribonuclease HII